MIFATYLGTKWVNRKVQLRPGNAIKVLERVNLGPDKAVVIVSVGEKCMLLGVSQQHVEKIDDLDINEVKALLEVQNTDKPSFSSALATVISQKFNHKGGDYNDKK